MDDLETTNNRMRGFGAELNARREAQADLARARRVLAKRVEEHAGRRASGRRLLSGRDIATQRTWTRRVVMAIVPIGIAAAAYVVVKPVVSNGAESGATQGIQEYRTQRAERSTFTLADGTRITLGPESTLQVMVGADTRSVALEGQAYFSITSNASAPFTVTTRQSVTRVLGTVFTVRAYPTDTVTQVAVAEGRVATGRTDASTVVLPGDVAYIASSGAPVVSHHGQTANIFGWMQGRIILDGQKFQDVIPDIERAYDITIVLQDSSVGQRDLRATLTSESVVESLDLIAEILGARYTRQGDTVVFSTHK